MNERKNTKQTGDILFIMSSIERAMTLEIQNIKSKVAGELLSLYKGPVVMRIGYRYEEITYRDDLEEIHLLHPEEVATGRILDEVIDRLSTGKVYKKPRPGRMPTAFAPFHITKRLRQRIADLNSDLPF